MSLFAAWANGSTTSMSSMGGGGFSGAATAMPSYAGSLAGRQGGGSFASAEHSTPVKASPANGSAPPPRPIEMLEASEAPQQKSAPPPMYQQSAPMAVQQLQLTQQTQYPGAMTPVASEHSARSFQQMQPNNNWQQATPQRQQIMANGSPDDIKKMLRDLQSTNPKKDTSSPATKQRQVLQAPENAEEEFEKQLKKVSGLTEIKEKPDLTGTLQELNFQDPPEHIQGLALREALKEISGKKEPKEEA